MFIRQLIIHTSNFSAQKKFYLDLQFPLIEFSKTSVSFGVGHSVLTFLQKKNSKPYHFAITIPGNKTEEALTWVKRRANVLKYHGNDIVDFKKWNALSFYFHDHDKNIVEFIARKNLNNNQQNAFSAKSLIEISEIGMAVKSVTETYNELNKLHNLPIYDGNLEVFCAAGDEHGLFIIIDKNKKNWMPCDEPAYTADFIMKGDFDIQFSNGKVKEFSSVF